MLKSVGPASACSIARSLDVLGEKWMILIMREALVAGTTRFSDFKDALGIAPNILTDRLNTLVEERLMERHSYKELGNRERFEYVLTGSGRELNLIIAALANWGRSNRPRHDGTSPAYTDVETGEAVELAFVTAEGRCVAPERVSGARMPDSATG